MHGKGEPNMIDPAILGWVAGVLDFQGHVLRRNNAQRAAGSFQISIFVDTAIPGIPERLCELTGSKAEGKEHHELKKEWLRRGCDEHCPEAHVHVREVAMPLTTRWSVTGVAMAVVLWNVRQYMTTNHEPWDWAMAQALSQVQLTGRGSAAIIAAVKRLSALGWDLPPILEGLKPKALTA
jgi:hypothetical protein